MAPDVGGDGAQFLAAIQPLRHLALEAGQAVAVVAVAVVDGQQIPRLGVEQEEQSVEQAQRALVDGVQLLPRLDRAASICAPVVADINCP